LGELTVTPLWFDSLGVKSSSLLVETPDLCLLVDPGAAEMQPSFPLPPKEKARLRLSALNTLRKMAKRADTVFISHYHYDHHTLPSEAPELYLGKQLWIKDPNRFINRSQWQRARLFLQELCRLQGIDPGSVLTDPLPFDGPPLPQDPRDLKWLKGLLGLWREGPWIKEGVIGNCAVEFADSRTFVRGQTRVRFTSPLFHGAQFERVGWVVGMVLEIKGHKLLYSSDLQGPVMEEYAAWILQEEPDILILDGPPTYLLGYMFGFRELERAIGNASEILRKLDASLILYDHHLPRDPLFRKRTRGLWELAERLQRPFLTLAEWLGKRPLVLELTESA